MGIFGTGRVRDRLKEPGLVMSLSRKVLSPQWLPREDDSVPENGSLKVTGRLYVYTRS